MRGRHSFSWLRSQCIPTELARNRPPYARPPCRFVKKMKTNLCTWSKLGHIGGKVTIVIQTQTTWIATC